MPLQKQNIPVPFTKGVDTKTDQKQLQPPSLAELENGVFIKPGKIVKRNGYESFSRTISGSTAEINEALGLARFRNELNLFTGSQVYSYLDALDRWAEKGTASSVVVDSKSIIRNNFEQDNPSGASNGRLEVYAWEDSRGGVRYSVLDNNSNTFIVSDAEIAASGSSPKVVALGNFIVVFYIEANSIRFTRISIVDPSSLEAPQNFTTNLDPVNQHYDIAPIGDRVFVTWNDDNATGGVSTRFVTAGFVFSSSVQFTGENADTCIAVVGTDALDAYVVYHDGSDVKCAVFDYNISSTLLSPTVVETVSDVVNITAVETSTDEITVLYEIENTVGSLDANFIRSNTINKAGTVGTASVFIRSLGLASAAFDFNNNQYVMAVHQSELQSTYFLLNLNGDISSKVSQGLAGGYTSKPLLPEMFETQEGQFLFPNRIKGALQSESGTLFTNDGVQSTNVDFLSLNNFIAEEIGNNLHLVGGILQSYDGISVTEKNFNLFPEGVEATITNVGAGSIADGTYQYSVVYAWQDNEGQLHRSAPSIPITVEIAGGPSDVELTIPTARVTKKEGVFIEVYRTEANRTLFYKLTSSTSLLDNDKTVDTITYADTAVDSAIISNEILYTTGGTLDNIAPPASSLMVSWGNRLALSGLEDPNLVWFSKERLEGEPVEFNDTLTFRVSPDGGPITALGVIDEKLIIFKEESIYLQVGDGPNNQGEQSDFGRPDRITSDAGCIDANSVVETPVGLMFKSKKGVYMLDRSLQVEYIGAPVEDFNGLTIRSATLVSNTNQVRFITSDDKALVYDYYFKEWSTFTNHRGVSSEMYENLFTYVRSDGKVLQETPGQYVDDATAIRMKLVTSWIQLAGISGFQRVYTATLLGTYKSPHVLKVRVGYDFNPAFTQQVNIDTTELVQNTNNYGNGSPYGTGDPVYGGEFNAYQWHIKPKIQKCTSIRFSVEDFQEDNFGEGFDISNMRFQIGVKTGANKLADGNSEGTS